mmetsp:Transcript_27831/g.60634  ORF Transcript_27831/g.60634 Transcript_27831/m.60634 type:complete len:269 (-) Transcript_27831:23-829(-)
MQRRFLHLLADHRGHKALAARVVCGGLHGVGVMLRALANGIDIGPTRQKQGAHRQVAVHRGEVQGGFFLVAIESSLIEALLLGVCIHGSPVVQQGAHCLQLPDLHGLMEDWDLCAAIRAHGVHLVVALGVGICSVLQEQLQEVAMFHCKGHGHVKGAGFAPTASPVRVDAHLVHICLSFQQSAHHGDPVGQLLGFVPLRLLSQRHMQWALPGTAAPDAFGVVDESRICTSLQQILDHWKIQRSCSFHQWSVQIAHGVNTVRSGQMRCC